METSQDPKGLGQLLGRSESLTKAKKNLKRKLIQTMIQQVMEELSDTEATVAEALEQVSQESDVLEQAKAALKARLLNQLMSEAIEEIGDEVGESPSGVDDLLGDLEEEDMADLDDIEDLDEEVIDAFEEMIEEEEDARAEEAPDEWEWKDNSPAEEALGEESSSDPFFAEEVSSLEEASAAVEADATGSGPADEEQEAEKPLAADEVDVVLEPLATEFENVQVELEEAVVGHLEEAAPDEEEEVETSGVLAAGFEDAETFIRDLSEHEELLFEGDFLETAQLEIEAEAEEPFAELESLDTALSFEDELQEPEDDGVAYFGDFVENDGSEEDPWLALPQEEQENAKLQGDSFDVEAMETPELIVEEPITNDLEASDLEDGYLEDGYLEEPADDATRLIDTDETRTIIWEDFQTPVAAPSLGYYVYGVMPGDSILNDAVLPQRSIHVGNPVFTYQHGTIQALVSRVPLPQFSKEMVREHIEDDQWVEQYAPAHEQVLEQAMQHATLIPMRFGTVFESEQELQRMLDGHQEAFKDTLSQLQGSQEWGMKIYCDVEQLRRRVMEDSNKVQELMHDIKSKPRGVAHFIKKQMVVAIHEEVESATQECVSASHKAFLEYAEDSKAEDVHEEKDQELGDLVMSAAYLVRRSDEGDFMSQMMNLRERFRSRGFSYSISGPFPPYSFAQSQATEGAS